MGYMAFLTIVLSAICLVPVRIKSSHSWIFYFSATPFISYAIYESMVPSDMLVRIDLFLLLPLLVAVAWRVLSRVDKLNRPIDPTEGDLM